MSDKKDREYLNSTHRHRGAAQVTTTLTDKQLSDAYHRALFYKADAVTGQLAGLRAVADLAITHAEAEIAGLNRELERVRMELTIAQRK